MGETSGTMEPFRNVTNVFRGCNCNATTDNDNSLESFQLRMLKYIVPQLVIMLSVSFGNVLVLLAVRRFRELQTSTNIFVVNLALADLSMGLVAVPLRIIILFLPILKREFFLCMLQHCGIVASCGVSDLTLVIISIDRYIAIEKPYSYSTIMTQKRSKMACAGVWTIMLIFAALPLLGWNHWSSGNGCTFTVVLPGVYVTFLMMINLTAIFLIGVLNAKIFITANAVSRAIERQVTSTAGQSNDKRYTQLFLSNKKAAKALLMVFGVFSVCTLPFVFITLREIYVLNEESRRHYSVIGIVTSFLALANSGMNPVIYHWRMPTFNAAFRKLLGIKRKVEPSTTTNHRTGFSTAEVKEDLS